MAEKKLMWSRLLYPDMVFGLISVAAIVFTAVVLTASCGEPTVGSEAEDFAEACVGLELAVHAVWKDCMDRNLFAPNRVLECQQYAAAVVCHPRSEFVRPSEVVRACECEGTRCSEWMSDAQAYREAVRQVEARLDKCAASACLMIGALGGDLGEDCEEEFINGKGDGMAEAALFDGGRSVFDGADP